MAGSNDFLQIANGGGANVLSQSAYAALTSYQSSGYPNGSIVPSQQLNKAMRQAATMSKVIGDIIAGVTGQNVVDDGSTATIEANFMATMLRAYYIDDSGAVNAYICNFAPALLGYYDGMMIGFSTVNSNTVTNPTINVNGLGPITITEQGGGPLFAGQIPANTVVQISYNSTGPRFELQSLSQGTRNSSRIQSVTAVASAGAITATLNKTVMDFRSATLSDGTTNTRFVNSPVSVVIPSGATLGATSTVAARIGILALDNAGVIELAVVNLVGQINFDETTLISTTAISAGATSVGVAYSTTARTSLPFRVVGFFDATVTAGAWATPTTVQGCGGQAIAALSSVGYGQTFVNVTRTSGVTYYNTTGKPIFAMYGIIGGSAETLTVNGVLCFSQSYGPISAIIPPNASYVIGGTIGLSQVELR